MPSNPPIYTHIERERERERMKIDILALLQQHIIQFQVKPGRKIPIERILPGIISIRSFERILFSTVKRLKRHNPTHITMANRELNGE